MVIALLAAPSWIEHLKIKRSPVNETNVAYFAYFACHSRYPMSPTSMFVEHYVNAMRCICSLFCS
jgi:hypothetical protein